MKFRATLGVVLIALLSASCGNEYKARGELYQCFIKGKAVYKSNVRPIHRGGKWFGLNGDVRKVDDCFCMGCIGL